MLNQPVQQPTGIAVFLRMFERIVLRLLGDRAHADIILTVKDGKVQLVRINQSYLPDALPRV